MTIRTAASQKAASSATSCKDPFEKMSVPNIFSSNAMSTTNGSEMKFGTISTTYCSNKEMGKVPCLHQSPRRLRHGGKN